ncbi:MAG: nucleotidyltransferase domain-containing protein [bacterium]
MQLIEKEKLDEIVSRLVAEFSPEKVILFGSYAWGKPHSDSDIDILVVVKNDNTKPTRRAARAYKCLRGLRTPVEVIVSTPNELKKYRNVPASLTRKILLYGSVLYG